MFYDLSNHKTNSVGNSLQRYNEICNSRSVLKGSFDEYPEELKEILIENNSLVYTSKVEYYGHCPIKDYRLTPWIYMGNNTEKLIKELSQIALDIKLISHWGLRYSYIEHNTRSEDFKWSPKKSMKLHLISLSIKIDETYYPVSLIYKNVDSYLDITNCRTYSFKDVPSNWLEYMNNVESLFDNINPDELEKISLEKFIKMCRGK